MDALEWKRNIIKTEEKKKKSKRKIEKVLSIKGRMSKHDKTVVIPIHATPAQPFSSISPFFLSLPLPMHVGYM